MSSCGVSICTQVIKQTPSADFTGRAEEARLLLHELAVLSPVEFVAALHLARGGRSRDLGRVIGDLVSECRKSKTVNGAKNYGRSFVTARKQALKNRIPELLAILGGRSS